MLTLQKIEAALSISRPIELYLFEHGESKFAYTSGSKSHLHVDGLIYNPLALRRGKLQRTNEDYKNRLSVELPGDSPVPSLFRSTLPSDHVTLKIFRTQRDLKNQFINIFAGEVVGVTWNNSVATLDCCPATALLRRQIMRTGYQSQCNHHLYDSRCSLEMQDWQEDTAVVAITNSGYTVQLANKAHADTYYTAGLLSKNGSDFRQINSVAGNNFELMSPIDGLQVGDVVQVAKGCDRSAASCQSFGNFDNFLGFLTIPTDNPFQA
jgi:uncharacterized phage protein (TIGR02218 family)